MNSKAFYKITWLRLYYLIWKSDLLMCRAYLSMTAYVWALSFLFLEGDRLVYSVMLSFWPKGVWALLFGTYAVVSSVAVLYGCRLKFSVLYDGLLGCILYTSVTVFLLLGFNRVSVAFSPDIVTAMLSWWCFVRYPMYAPRR